ncbi:MAG: tRNA (N6-isopentenyl adenosine(37)-C2)-methylthiotransferase MiaB [Bacteroidetes bacterium HGW-Bacteroidetes-7]|nr:MAG: tRNA (N6-isopentenyl adenosine(37)-C2)-methylthiotransferase MiaB [Bacteroidetes bacterium HGW-Bacteroidetes-7]
MTIKFHSVKPILDNNLKQVYIETYGCQMNVNDSEVVLSVLQPCGYSICDKIQDASLILVNTCSIRDNAEQKVWARIKQLGYLKRKKKGLKIGILGCMAERLKEKLLENGAVDIVAGPDSYRELPSLIEALSGGDKQINTMLSQEETYADISPVRMDKNGVSAYIAIMRGCNNFCSYCVVPYVRGRERSRNPQSIINEARELFENGYKEVTLLGQNVNSYLWEREVTFAKLLEMVAKISPQLRVRFSTSHPKDMDDSVLHTIAAFENICRHVHLPIQSGSNDVLKRMNRKYTREEYLAKVKKIKDIIPESTISTDMIAGFSGETEADHLETLSVMREVGYYTAFMFQYSERPDTKAAEMYPDDVPHEIKNRRLNEIIALQNELSHISNMQDMDKIVEVLVEGTSKRSTAELVGRTSQNKICVFPAGEHKVGDYVKVKVTSYTSATLKGILV